MKDTAFSSEPVFAPELLNVDQGALAGAKQKMCRAEIMMRSSSLYMVFKLVVDLVMFKTYSNTIIFSR